MVFADDDNAIDTKSHFEYIISKIDFNAENFVNAVEEAIAMKLGESNGVAPKKPKVVEPDPIPVVDELEETEEEEEDDEIPFDLDDELDEEVELEFDFEAARTIIRNKNKAGTAEQKKRVKELIADTGVKLDQIEDEDVLKEILAVFE
jgi:hypothetical protein